MTGNEIIKALEWCVNNSIVGYAYLKTEKMIATIF